MKTKKLTGIYWHCHHDIICEYVYDYQERVDYIKKEKPKNEIKTRLKLFKPVKVKLPKKDCGCSEWNGKEIVFK